MAHANSTKFLLDAAESLAKPLPAPPLRLQREAKRFWPVTYTAKRPDAWTDQDLLIAAHLCNDLARADKLAADLDRDGLTLVDKNGRHYAHPALAALDATQRRIMATCRCLQINSLATQGRIELQPNKNRASRELAGKLYPLPELIARPKAKA